MNNKEFEQMVKDASPQDLSSDDLNCSIEFYRYQNRMERRYLGECIQLASRFKKYRIEVTKSLKRVKTRAIFNIQSQFTESSCYYSRISLRKKDKYVKSLKISNRRFTLFDYANISKSHY